MVILTWRSFRPNEKRTSDSRKRKRKKNMKATIRATIALPTKIVDWVLQSAAFFLLVLTYERQWVLSGGVYCFVYFNSA